MPTSPELQLNHLGINGMSQLHQGVSTVGYTNNLQSAIMALGDQFNMVPTAPGLWLALMNNPPS